MTIIDPAIEFGFMSEVKKYRFIEIELDIGMVNMSYFVTIIYF